MKKLAFLVAALLGTNALGQSLPPGVPPLPKLQPKLKVDTEGLIHVAANTDWRAWLSRHYPDREKTWPEKARLSFETLAKGGRRDFVGTGDYGGDKTPMAILIRFLPSKKPDAGAMSTFVIAKWVQGRWTRPVILGAQEGARLNGKTSDDLADQDGYLIDLVRGNPANVERPGILFLMELANRYGTGMSDPAQLYFSVKQKEFVLNDDFGQ